MTLKTIPLPSRSHPISTLHPVIPGSCLEGNLADKLLHVAPCNLTIKNQRFALYASPSALDAYAYAMNPEHENPITYCITANCTIISPTKVACEPGVQLGLAPCDFAWSVAAPLTTLFCVTPVTDARHQCPLAIGSKLCLLHILTSAHSDDSSHSSGQDRHSLVCPTRGRSGQRVSASRLMVERFGCSTLGTLPNIQRQGLQRTIALHA